MGVEATQIPALGAGPSHPLLATVAAFAAAPTRRRDELPLRLQASVGRLRAVEGLDSLLTRGVKEIVDGLGFSRAVLFRIRSARLVAEVVYFGERPEWAEELLEFSQAHAPRLDHLLAETEMLRRRRPLLIADPVHDRNVNRELAGAFRTRGYVAAPVIVGGEVAGFLHADRYFDEPGVDEFDRDVLWAFAEAFGTLLDRAAAEELNRRQREQMELLLASLGSTLDSFAGLEHGRLADIEAMIGDYCPVSADGALNVAALRPVAPPHNPAAGTKLEYLLTRRELEVLDLMAAGATNGEIAERLVIAEGTVKSHVKHILRKMRSANRAEAVSRYVRHLHSRQA
jgi:DNA-binding CsgD family transcriptional regulator